LSDALGAQWEEQTAVYDLAAYDLYVKNDFITVTISKTGGEVLSARGADGVEYMWRGDSKYWSGRSPHLFPITGRLFEDRYTVADKAYSLERHGFFRRMELRLAEYGLEYLLLRTENEKTLYRRYPFRWEAELEYCLEGPTLRVIFRVSNLGRKTMRFAYGGHPGFAVPLIGGLAFEDYYLQFDPSTEPYMIGLSKDGLVEGPEARFALNGGGRLELRHRLFDKDAIFLRGSGENVTLKSDLDAHGVSVSYPGMKFLGIWHTPQTDAPFVCVEPWTSMPARQGVVEDLELKDDMISLGGHDTYQNEWSMTFL
jgi:galactose mutarotase-like enzyme